MTTTRAGQMVDIGDCELYISVLGNGFPLILLHGGPGLDHHAFGDYIDPLADQLQLIYVDERGRRSILAAGPGDVDVAADGRRRAGPGTGTGSARLRRARPLPILGAGTPREDWACSRAAPT